MTDSAVMREPRVSPLYRIVWRWHFYAGLIVLPFMILLAVTGGIYLFKDEINAAAYRDLKTVEPGTAAPLSPAELAANALEAHPGTLKAYLPAATAETSAQFNIVGSDGVKDSVYVNPYTGVVLGSAWDGGAAGSPVMFVVRKIHSLDYLGWWANRIIEAVAGWAILLVATGTYLWWPRKRNVGVLRVRRSKGRPFWRDLHAVTGIYTAFFIVFLALSGLPWSGFWGSQFYDIADNAGLGMPDGYWGNYPTSTIPTGDALDRAPWILEKKPMPVSGADEGVPVGLDQIVRTVESAGIHPGYALNMPNGPEGVFTASVYPDDVTAERVIHLDQYSGQILFDMGLSDLGALGAAAEWGVSVHMGQAFGLPNQLVLLGACIAIVLMAISGIAMWWKRRPAGTFGAPSVPADARIPRGVFVIAIVAGLFLPLVGLTLIVAAAVELAIHLAKRRHSVA